MRKNNVNNINLKIDKVIIKNDAIRLEWSSDIGYGQYDIHINDGAMIGLSETMDSDEDKDFLKKLFSLWADKIMIIS
jgi:hypothetical protein